MCSQKGVAATFAAFAVRVTRVWNAFFGIQSHDSNTKAGYKVGKIIAQRVIYTMADYWLMALSAAFIIVVDKALGYEWFGLFMAMWGFDIVVACAFVAIWTRTGEDVTLGESYRRAADAIHAESRIAGYLAMAGVCIKASFWDGPEHIVIFFHKEIGNEGRMLAVLLALTAIQAAIWTPVYVLGFDTASELFTHIMNTYVR